MDDQDRYRFVENLFEFNDKRRVLNRGRLPHHLIDIASQSEEKTEKREILVHIHAFCLMDNHYHLLLSTVIENGIFHFMKKINMGYAKYFNTKYKRTGALFQGRYKSVPIEQEHHFNYIPFYIHFNPLDFEMPEWRLGKLKNKEKALAFLGSYRWSSHLDYLGKNNFPSILKRDELLEFFDGENGYKKSLGGWLDYVSEEHFGKTSLE